MWLAAAGLCFAVAIIALVIAVFFQFGTWIPTPQSRVPAPYEAQPGAIDFNAIEARLRPPTNIHVVILSDIITKPLTGQEVLGYFDASTANGLARYPDDFDILGGKDVDLFDRTTYYGSAPRAALRATGALIDQINTALPALRTAQQKTFILKVVARDSLGNRSAPVNVSFSLTYGPPGATAAARPATQAQQMSDLQILARDIAQTLDPEKSEAYFYNYDRALKVPARCGVSENNGVFISDYRSAFEHVRKQLTLSNIEAFYAGVCDAWGQVLRDAAAADAERNDVIAKNGIAEMAAETAKFAARAARDTALVVVGGAFVLFMWIALFLAFLAMETHSKALREAVETLAKSQQPAGVPPS